MFRGNRLESRYNSLEAGTRNVSTTLDTKPLAGLQIEENYASDAILTQAIGGISANTTLASLEALSTGDLLKELFKDTALWQTVPASIPVVRDSRTTVTLASGTTSTGDHLISTDITGAFEIQVQPGYWAVTPIPYSASGVAFDQQDYDPAHLSVSTAPSVTFNGVSITLNDPSPALTQLSASGYTFAPGTSPDPEHTFAYTPNGLGDVTLNVSGAVLGPTLAVYDNKGDLLSIDGATAGTVKTWTVYAPVYTATSVTTLASATNVATKLRESSQYQMFKDVNGVPTSIGTKNAVEFEMDAHNGIAYIPVRGGVAPNYVNALIQNGPVSAWVAYNGSSQGVLTLDSTRYAVHYYKLVIGGASTAPNLNVRVGYDVQP